MKDIELMLKTIYLYCELNNSIEMHLSDCEDKDFDKQEYIDKWIIAQYYEEEFGDIPRYSGQKTIYTLLYKLLQNFSIYFPFITEEIYQELYHDNKSIHLTKIKQLAFNFEEELKYGNMICDIISRVRGEKSINNLSLKTEVKELDLSCEKNLESAINSSIKDFKATLFIDTLLLKNTYKDYTINKIILNEE